MKSVIYTCLLSFFFLSSSFLLRQYNAIVRSHQVAAHETGEQYAVARSIFCRDREDLSPEAGPFESRLRWTRFCDFIHLVFLILPFSNTAISAGYPSMAFSRRGKSVADAGSVERILSSGMDGFSISLTTVSTFDVHLCFPADDHVPLHQR